MIEEGELLVGDCTESPCGSRFSSLPRLKYLAHTYGNVKLREGATRFSPGIRRHSSTTADSFMLQLQEQEHAAALIAEGGVLR
jgi:hypothetical protein